MYFCYLFVKNCWKLLVNNNDNSSPFVFSFDTLIGYFNSFQSFLSHLCHYFPITLYQRISETNTYHSIWISNMRFSWQHISRHLRIFLYYCFANIGICDIGICASKRPSDRDVSKLTKQWLNSSEWLGRKLWSGLKGKCLWILNK